MNPIVERIRKRAKIIDEQHKLIIEDLLEYEKSLDKGEKKPIAISSMVKPLSMVGVRPSSFPCSSCVYPPKVDKKLKSNPEVKK